MGNKKPTLFIGKAIMLDGFGETETGNIYYTAVRLHRDRDNYFGRAALFLKLDQLLKVVKSDHKNSSFAKITFEPPGGIDFRESSNKGRPRRYEALELEEIYTVQRILDLF